MEQEEIGDGLGRPAVTIGGVVERVDGRALSYDEFVERYLKPNRPVVLTGLMDDWRAVADWVAPDGCSPNLQFFSSHFGNSLVQVADCSTREFTDQKRREMSVTEFISYWINLSSEKGGFCNDENESLLYLKDWHFVKEYPDYVAYKTPPFFTDDWLNLYLDNHLMHRDSDIHHDKNEINCADYRFVYMGPKGTCDAAADLCSCVLGLLFTLMFSGHTVGLQMFVGENSGSFYHLHSVILCLTGILDHQYTMFMMMFLGHSFLALERQFG